MNIEKNIRHQVAVGILSLIFRACQLSAAVGLLSLSTFRRITILDGIDYNVPNSSAPSVPSGKLSLNMLQMVNVTIGFYTSHKNKWNS